MCSISDTLNTNAPRKYVLYIRHTQHKYPQEKSAMYQIHLTQMSPGNVQYIRYTQRKCPQEMCYVSDTLKTNVPKENCTTHQIHSTLKCPEKRATCIRWVRSKHTAPCDPASAENLSLSHDGRCEQDLNLHPPAGVAGGEEKALVHDAVHLHGDHQ